MANNSAALGRLQSGGVKVMEFPDSVWDAFGAASKEVIEGPMDDPIYKDCYDSYMKSLQSSAAWGSRSEGAYTAQRNRVIGI
jgi:TRAP-type mannitol/chloroaromatic compound transport system substrate-binding protein